ncbi:DUF92 domain-containing protein [Flavitalea flava]
MSIRLLVLFLILITGAVYSIRARKLTMPAAVAGVVLALLVYGGSGFTGIVLMTFFFLSGSAATSWKLKWKQQNGLAETNKGIRNAMQVIANAGIPALAGLAGILDTQNQMPYGEYIVPLLIAAAFAAATADTLSSELGNIYGTRYYNILSFKKDQRGLNGVISLEGSLWGLTGSIFISIIFVIGFGWSSSSFLIIILAGTIGNIFDSILGASVERREWIGNNAVNFLNTLVAALSAWGLSYFF